MVKYCLVFSIHVLIDVDFGHNLTANRYLHVTIIVDDLYDMKCHGQSHSQ